MVSPARPEPIRSTRNPIIARIRAAGEGDLPDEMAVDGRRIAWEALRADLRIRVALVSPRLHQAKDGRDLERRLRQTADEYLFCTDDVLARASALKTHQGVVLVAETPARSLEDLAGSCIVAVSGVRDPGNLGAILRCSEAAGADGFLSLRGSADPFRDKAVRGSSGSVFRLPTVRDVPEEQAIGWAASAGLRVVACDGTAEQDYLQADLSVPTLLVFGSEGSGLQGPLAQGADQRIRVPMQPAVDSLNVSVAAGIILYEMRRQRL